MMTLKESNMLTKNEKLTKKELKKTDVQKTRIKKLEGQKLISLKLSERISMKYAGWVDGRKGLLRCDENGEWCSSVLKQEVDAFEEFCAKQIALLKIEEENEFREMNVLFDKVIPLRKKIYDAKAKVDVLMNEQINFNQRKPGEESLTDVQVDARRRREHNKLLQPLQADVAQYTDELWTTINKIYEKLSQIKESFDSTMKMNERMLQHSQRKIDVYWRSAMHHVPDLPPLPKVKFSNNSEQSFAAHYEMVAQRAEKLRTELEAELKGEMGL